MNDRSFSTGRLCVDDFEFLYATSQTGDFHYNGVLGLQPSFGKNSFIEMMRQHGQFPGNKAIVGLNFENPIDTDQ